MQLESAALTHQGYVRKTNQDAILALQAQGLFAVADGLGGERAGDEAAARVIAAVLRTGEGLEDQKPAGADELEALLRGALDRANEDIREHATDPAKWGMGSTATVLCLHRGIYCTAHVGDSRVYLMRNGTLRLLTRDHTLVWMLYEEGKLERDELEHHADRHLLTQCVGTLQPIEIDTARGALREGDLFLICSDGLNGYIAEERIRRLLMEGDQSIGARADGLLNEALRAGGGDNVSVVLVRVAALEDADNWQPVSSSGAAGDPLTQTVEEDEPAAAGVTAAGVAAAGVAGQCESQTMKIKSPLVVNSVAVGLTVLLLVYFFGTRFF